MHIKPAIRIAFGFAEAAIADQPNDAALSAVNEVSQRIAEELVVRNVEGAGFVLPELLEDPFAPMVAAGGEAVAEWIDDGAVVFHPLATALAVAFPAAVIDGASVVVAVPVIQSTEIP